MLCHRRKPHNHGADIVPQIVEDMLAEGFTATEIAFYFDVDRTTVLKRCKQDAELREAFRVGRDRRRDKLVRKFHPRNAADELEVLLVDLLKEVREMRTTA